MGQVYNRQNQKGFVLMVVALTTLIVACAHWPAAMLIIAGSLWVLSIIDATAIARRVIEGEVVRAWQWF